MTRRAFHRETRRAAQPYRNSMDTQWPRFHVLVQVRDGDPYLDYGSVHAPDIEMALLNARDVFARRPEAVSMWVVPAQAIFGRTAEELKSGTWENETQASSGDASAQQRYHVFCKPRPAGTQTQAGEVEAGSPQQALERALAAFLQDFSPLSPPEVWWVFPAAAVYASQAEDIPSLYLPAFDKGFRLSTEFRTHSAMRDLKGKRAKEGSSHG